MRMMMMIRMMVMRMMRMMMMRMMITNDADSDHQSRGLLQVHVQDVDPGCFTKVLRLIYTGVVDVDDDQGEGEKVREENSKMKKKHFPIPIFSGEVCPETSRHRTASGDRENKRARRRRRQDANL